MRTSLRPRARATGLVYFLYFATAIFAAILTAHGLVAYGNAANLIANAMYIAVTLLFYEMFKPVNTRLSLIAAFCSVLGCIIQTLALFHLAPFHLSPFLFFGPYCLLLGYLIFRSTYLPRVLGAMMILAGFGWVIFLSPSLAHQISSYIKGLGIFAEGSLMLWLIIVGVNAPKWEHKANGKNRLAA